MGTYAESLKAAGYAPPEKQLDVRAKLAEDHAHAGPQRADQMQNDMKEIARRRLARRVLLQDPSQATKLMATQSSPVYNASGNLIMSVSTHEFEVS